MSSRARRFALMAVALNACLWLAFLTREPLPPSEFASWDAEVGVTEKTMVRFTYGPDIVASRPVVRAAHGEESPIIVGYEWLALPGLMLGAGLYEAASSVLYSRVLFESTSWFWGSSEARSWFLAGGLFVGTSLWFALIGWSLGRRRSTPQTTGPDNNALHQTKREGAPASQAVVEARLAGERECWAGRDDAR